MVVDDGAVISPFFVVFMGLCRLLASVEGHALSTITILEALKRLFYLAILIPCGARIALAQELAPRAYIIVPTHSNAVTFTWSFYDGGIDFNGAVPASNATGIYSVPVLSYYHAFSFFGRSTNFTGVLPYGVGNFKGNINGSEQSSYRSGLLDASARLSVNLFGGPAMPLQEFRKWKQNTIVGASVKIIVPTGQYGPAKLVNWGSNRWSFKPELGLSRRIGNWILDGYGGAWLYATNPAFGVGIPKPLPQTEAPIGSFEGHLSYDFKKVGLWASFDGNFWWGGTTALEGNTNPATTQRSSRLGGTFSVPIAKHQTIKVSYSDGTYVRFGSNYNNLQVAWQYSWIGKRW